MTRDNQHKQLLVVEQITFSLPGISLIAIPGRRERDFVTDEFTHPS